jgi:hypothetical protein
VQRQRSGHAAHAAADDGNAWCARHSRPSDLQMAQLEVVSKTTA